METFRPLAGTRVLDLTRILAGPYCTLLLSDLGADVVKVERPGRGDDTRWWGPPFLDGEEGMATYFASLNRGKRSVAMDLRSAAGRKQLDHLVRNVHVVIENFRPGRAESLGLGAEHLHAINPSLVSCSISGYGADGEYSELPGTEIVVEAMSGLMDVTGAPDGDPVRFGIAMTDIATGLTAATRIVAELLRVSTTGVGRHIECSLYASALGALGTLVTAFSATGVEPRRWGSHHPTVVPYGGFKARDGHLITGVINDAMWELFCDAIGSSALRLDERYRSNAGRVAHRAELEEELARHFETESVGYWLERLRGAGLLAAPIRTVGEAVADPVTAAMGLFVELGAYPGVISPRLDHQRTDGAPQAVPRLGEHTVEVFAELGIAHPSSSRPTRTGTRR